MKKISVSLNGHQTSISLEPEFFDALNKLAKKNSKSIAELINTIDQNRTLDTNLSSAIRIWVFKQYYND